MDADELERHSKELFLSDQRKGRCGADRRWDNTVAHMRERGQGTPIGLTDEEREGFRERVRAGERASDA